MEEEKVAEGEHAETRANNSSSSLTKAGGGRPQGSKKLKVCVTDLNWTNLIAADCEPTQHQEGGRASKLPEANHAKNPSQTHRGRGRPKGSKKPASNEDGSIAEHFPKKRGRPKKVHPSEDLPNGGSNAPKRGRPKGSIKHKSETETGEEDGGSSAMPRERGRPKGSPNKKPRLESSLSAGGGPDQKKNSQKKRRGRPRKAELTKSTFNGMTKTRGRPRKKHQEIGNQEPLTDGSPPKKRGRGRPKGSLNKKPSGKLGRPPKVSALSAKGRKRGRPCHLPAKRGRPRKYPLPPPEELNKPKVWKPLGRPRKYPRVEPPEGTPAAPRRARGRPRKSESKKAAHLHRSIPTSPPALHGPSDGAQKKKGRPQNDAKREGDAPKKRGRPKGSVNKNKAPTPPSHSKAASDSSAVGERREAEEEVEAVPADSSDSGEKQILRDSDVNFTRQDTSRVEGYRAVSRFPSPEKTV